MERKIWSNPEILELNVQNTEFGGDNPKNIDGPYVEIQKQKYWPSGS